MYFRAVMGYDRRRVPAALAEKKTTQYPRTLPGAGFRTAMPATGK